MNLNTNIFEGNLADAPKLVHVQGGVTAVLEAVVLVNRRAKDTAGEWADAEPTRYRIKAWNRLAENIATLPKGARVLVVGHTEIDAWADKETQQKRTGDVVVVDAIGASLRYATVTLGPGAGTREEANWDGPRRGSPVPHTGRSSTPTRHHRGSADPAQVRRAGTRVCPEFGCSLTCEDSSSLEGCLSCRSPIPRSSATMSWQLPARGRLR